MSEDIREQLSALMDGELGRDERAFLLRRLEHDAELRSLWSSMHLMRDVITHRPGGAPLNLADRVMQSLAEEDRQIAPLAKSTSRSWRRRGRSRGSPAAVRERFRCRAPSRA